MVARNKMPDGEATVFATDGKMDLLTKGKQLLLLRRRHKLLTTCAGAAGTRQHPLG